MPNLTKDERKLFAALKEFAFTQRVNAVPLVRNTFMTDGDDLIGMTRGLDALHGLHRKGLVIYNGEHNVAGLTIPTVQALK